MRIAEALQQETLVVVEGHAGLGSGPSRGLGETVEGGDALRREPVERWRRLDRAQRQALDAPAEIDVAIPVAAVAPRISTEEATTATTAADLMARDITLTADGVNLTNEKIIQFDTDRFRPRAVYDNGRYYFVGLRFQP